MILEDEADRGVAERRQLARREQERIAAVERDRAGARRLERAEQVEQRALAAPDGPMMAAASPGASENDTSDSTVSGPRGVGYCLVRFET